MSEPGDSAGLPAEERRGGEHPDWDNTRPGEPLPEKLEPGDRVRLHAEGVFSEGTLDGEDAGRAP